MQHNKPRYPLAEAFELLGLSRSKGYIRVREGRLQVTYDGDAPFVTAENIDRYAAEPQPRADYTPVNPRTGGVAAKAGRVAPKASKRGAATVRRKRRSAQSTSAAA
jgi:hypothetical protein